MRRWAWFVGVVVLVAAVVALAVNAGGSDDDRATSTDSVPADAPGPGDGGDAAERPGSEGDDRAGASSPIPADTATPAVDVEESPPVAVDEPAWFGNDLVVTVTGIEPAELEARGPGQTAGPGVVVTLEVRNAGAAPIDAGGVVVNAAYGHATPADPNYSDAAEPLSGMLEPGATATGSYAFRVPSDQVDSLVLDIHHATSPNVVVVEADAP